METDKRTLKLFDHNQSAYESAMALMQTDGRAAIIHPTGTGKSFIGFKLAEEHPKSRILWLSPSEYIFRTQVENLRRVLASESQFQRILAGIRFLTYSGLMRNGNCMEDLQPDYIVLDEFHRCGALEWEKSVRRLLAKYPRTRVLGLSATSVRYLDGQRDMAQELFGGCTASEMSLGEAIGKRILPSPDYVISLYSCQEELHALKMKISSEKNPGVREENEMLLEELRRALEKAEGLDQIFYKYMRKPDGSIYRGKYIVFCSGREHMEAMMKKSKEWFALVDPAPHIYGVYYDNPCTSKEFADFKEDESSHLRLLFCIDMLNEGVHVENIDGVILLRPTVSPILYLQQIGRALSAAGSSKVPIIFDIVNNFKSLSMIDVLRQETEEEFSIRFCKEKDFSKFHGAFRVFDETKDCRELFERLHRNLTSAWELYYQAAKAYYEENGNLRVVKSYITDQGLTLGLWLMTQRRIRLGKAVGKLTEEQIHRLDAIGMEWEAGSDRKWKRGYEALCRYRERYGNVDVNCRYVTEEGYALGKWVSNLRSKWNRGEFIAREQQQLLDELGMIWDKQAYKWEVNFRNAKLYYQEHGNLNAPRDYKAEDGSLLGVWLENQRQTYAGSKKNAVPLSRRQIERLEAIGMVWRKNLARGIKSEEK